MSVLVGRQAPDFTAKAVMGDGSINESFNLKSYLNGQKGLLFFWPLDFTFVCPSEIIAFNKRMAEFEARNTRLIGISVDSHFTHYAWRETPVNKGGIGPVSFPMVSDLTKSISRDYDVLINDAVALRGTFLIAEDGRVVHQLVNDLPLGRNVDETLRTLDAFIFHTTSGEVCPAGWQRGQDGMKASAAGVADYLSKHKDTL